MMPDEGGFGGEVGKVGSRSPIGFRLGSSLVRFPKALDQKQSGS